MASMAVDWVVSSGGGLRGSLILKSQNGGATTPQTHDWRADYSKLLLGQSSGKFWKSQTLLTKLPVQGSERIIPLGQLAFVIVGGEKVAGERRDDR